MPDENTTIQYKQLLDNGEPFYPMVGKSSYSEWIGYEEIGGSGVHPDDQWIGFVDVGGATDVPPYIVPVANGGTGADNALTAKTNLGAVGFANSSQGIISGSIAGTEDKTITATDDCVVYLLWAAQANTNLTFQIWLNGVRFINYESGGAVNLTASIVPFFLKKGDSLRIAQSNNRACGYSIFKLG